MSKMVRRRRQIFSTRRTVFEVQKRYLATAPTAPMVVVVAHVARKQCKTALRPPPLPSAKVNASMAYLLTKATMKKT